MTPAIITLLTDFGLKDGYVASMKGVILGICPHARLVDVSHLVPPRDIRSGAFLLGQVYKDFPTGTVHVAVVDPGVGTGRRALALEAGGCFFVGPDNGLFSRVLRREKAVQARSLEISDYWRSPVSRTFHGRDVFAPVAAHLASGVALDALGPECTPLIAPWSFPVEKEGGLLGEVVYVDHFGNAVTNVERKDMDRFASPYDLTVTVEGYIIHGMIETYGESGPGSVVALIGSSDHLEIAVNGGSASETLEIGAGSRVEVRG
jgi:hypothetical protein